MLTYVTQLLIDSDRSSPSFNLWLFNIAMENDPFIDGLPIKNGDFPWLCLINNQMVNIGIYI